MASVMHTAIHLDEDTYQAQQEYIARLEAENQGLRDLVLITNGQLGSRLISKTPKTSVSDEKSDSACEIAEKTESALPENQILT